MIEVMSLMSYNVAKLFKYRYLFLFWAQSPYFLFLTRLATLQTIDIPFGAFAYS